MILASASQGDVLVALFSAITAALTVGIPAWLRARKADKKIDTVEKQVEKHGADIKDTLGEKNGHGDVVNMLTLSLDNQGRFMAWTLQHDDKDERRFGQVNERLEALGGKIAALEDSRGSEGP